MNAEIVAIGTELLLGQIVNSNAQALSQRLAEIGVDVYRHVTVGDNLGRMTEAIQNAVARADAVIVTGGLGPTPDDITREAMAAATGLPLIRDERLAGIIESIFDRLGRAMPEANYRQAHLPQGAVPIDPVGSAPGIMLEHDGCLIIALPGVPWEMKAMLDSDVIPELSRRSGDSRLVTHTVLVMGLGESATHAKIADIVDAQSNPTIAFLAGGGHVRVRITAKAGSKEEAEALIEPAEHAIRDRLGLDAVAGNYENVADAVSDMLVERGETIAAAESLTGGLIGVALTARPGSSGVLQGSFVVYATEAKSDVAGVDPSVLDGPGPVSEESAAQLAEGAAKRFKADLGVSATGVAGPDSQDGKPVGTVYVGASYAGMTEVRYVRGYGDRDNIRAIAVNAALDLGRRLLIKRTS